MKTEDFHLLIKIKKDFLITSFESICSLKPLPGCQWKSEGDCLSMTHGI